MTFFFVIISFEILVKFLFFFKFPKYCWSIDIFFPSNLELAEVEVLIPSFSSFSLFSFTVSKVWIGNFGIIEFVFKILFFIIFDLFWEFDFSLSSFFSISKSSLLSIGNLLVTDFVLSSIIFNLFVLIFLSVKHVLCILSEFLLLKLSLFILIWFLFCNDKFKFVKFKDSFIFILLGENFKGSFIFVSLELFNRILILFLVIILEFLSFSIFWGGEWLITFSFVLIWLIGIFCILVKNAYFGSFGWILIILLILPCKFIVSIINLKDY